MGAFGVNVEEMDYFFYIFHIFHIYKVLEFLGGSGWGGGGKEGRLRPGTFSDGIISPAEALFLDPLTVAVFHVNVMLE